MRVFCFYPGRPVISERDFDQLKRSYSKKEFRKKELHTKECLTLL